MRALLRPLRGAAKAGTDAPISGATVELRGLDAQTAQTGGDGMPGTDGVNDSVSLGIGVQAVKGTYTLPAQ